MTRLPPLPASYLAECARDISVALARLAPDELARVLAMVVAHHVDDIDVRDAVQAALAEHATSEPRRKP